MNKLLNKITTSALLLILAFVPAIAQKAKAPAKKPGKPSEQVAAPTTAPTKDVDGFSLIGKSVPEVSLLDFENNQSVPFSKFKGKITIITFWATWCGPCIKELPNVKSTFEKLNAKGFEIIGVSLDQERAELEKMIAEKKMTWPQYFEGGEKNKFADEFQIASIPTMWLVDKKGNLRDLNGRENLAAKVEKLLAE